MRPTATAGEDRVSDTEILLEDALASLPASDRDVVFLRFHDDLAVNEVGERLGIGAEHGAMPLPSERALALAGRFASGVAAGGLAAAALTYPDGAPPAPSTRA